MIVDKEQVRWGLSLNENNSGYEGFYCIHTSEFYCSCSPKPWRYVHWRGRILVWEESDDPIMLYVASKAKEVGRDPRIEEFKPAMGDCVSWKEIPSGSDIAI